MSRKPILPSMESLRSRRGNFPAKTLMFSRLASRKVSAEPNPLAFTLGTGRITASSLEAMISWVRPSRNHGGISADRAVAVYLAAAPPDPAAVIGGHSFVMEADLEGETIQNIGGCEVCHETVDDFNIDGIQDSVVTLAATLRTRLVAANLLSAGGNPVCRYDMKTGEVTTDSPGCTGPSTSRSSSPSLPDPSSRSSAVASGGRSSSSSGARIRGSRSGNLPRPWPTCCSRNSATATGSPASGLSRRGGRGSGNIPGSDAA